ncbi:MAG: pentapeptide repeat-containing protein [Bacteroidota bacterium]
MMASIEETHFPLSEQPGSDCSNIDKKRIAQYLIKGPYLSKKEIDLKIQQHLQFLQNGGAGGKWQMVHLKGLVVALYFGREALEGKQATFELQRISPRSDLQKVVLPFSNFCASELIGVNFQEADLSYSVLTDTLAKEINFEGANLAYTDFTRANLRGANFRNANLFGADFENCDLTDANFCGANLNQAKFPGATLRNVQI